MAKNKFAMGGLWVIGIMFFLCFVFAWFCPDPNKVKLVNQFAPPSAEHWFGTDALGRDLFARILYGGQVSILVGLIATAVSVFIGIIYGAISGFAGGRSDAFMMRIVDTLLAIPFLVLVIVLQATLSDWSGEATKWIVDNLGWGKEFTARLTNVVPLFFALGLLGWLTLSRIVRAQVMSIKEREFVEAAVALGYGKGRILFRHVIPNVLGPTVVYSTLTVPGFIMYEAILSFLGLGVESPNSSWGVLIKEGANFLETEIQLLLLPAYSFLSPSFPLIFSVTDFGTHST